MNGNINESMYECVKIAVRDSNYFQENPVKEFEIVNMDFIDDNYKILDNMDEYDFRMLVLVKHPEIADLSNYTAFTIVANPLTWEMIAMYDGGACVGDDGEIWGHNIEYGSLTRERATQWLKESLEYEEVA